VPGPFVIGQQSSSTLFRGQIDDAKFFDVSVSETQAQALYGTTSEHMSGFSLSLTSWNRLAIDFNGGVALEREGSARTLTVGQWNHIAVVKKAGLAASKTQVFVNAEETPALVGTSDVPQFVPGAMAAGMALHGQVDDIRAFSKPLSFEHVQQLHRPMNLNQLSNGKTVFKGLSVDKMGQQYSIIFDPSCFEESINFEGHDLTSVPSQPTVMACLQACAADSWCTHWTYQHRVQATDYQTCYLKYAAPTRQVVEGLRAGPRD
jgi:hypothetical protein